MSSFRVVIFSVAVFFCVAYSQSTTWQYETTTDLVNVSLQAKPFDLKIDKSHFKYILNCKKTRRNCKNKLNKICSFRSWAGWIHKSNRYYCKQCPLFNKARALYYRGQERWFHFGERRYDDRLVSQNYRQLRYPQPRDVLITLRYPFDQTTATVSYVLISIESDYDNTGAYIVDGAIGHNNIAINVFGYSTRYFAWTFQIYGYPYNVGDYSMPDYNYHYFDYDG